VKVESFDEPPAELGKLPAQLFRPHITEDVMNTIERQIPKPIVHESRIRRGDGSDFTILRARMGDSFNLSTGEVRVARIIGGIRYDTTQADLVFGYGDFHGYCCYRLYRLYRTSAGRFFWLHMQWAEEEGFVGMDAISILENDRILPAVKIWMSDSDVREFLLNWYCPGWLPLDDTFAQPWAESVLSADDCEKVLAAMSGRGPEQTSQSGS
jgi:hypothetical protein